MDKLGHCTLTVTIPVTTPPRAVAVPKCHLPRTLVELADAFGFDYEPDAPYVWEQSPIEWLEVSDG